MTSAPGEEKIVKLLRFLGLVEHELKEKAAGREFLPQQVKIRPVQFSPDHEFFPPGLDPFEKRKHPGHAPSSLIFVDLDTFLRLDVHEPVQ